jgi:hypothetical protein
VRRMSWLAGSRLSLAWAAVLVLLAPAVRAADEWRSVETPHYTVISQLSERDTRLWAVEFDLFINAVTTQLDLDTAALPPLTVVLFAQDRDAARYRPAARESSRNAKGYFVREETWSAIGFAASGADEATRQAIFHEGSHWLTNADPAPQPRWLAEGIAEVFSTFSARGIHAHWGEPVDSHLELLRTQGLLPLREFLERSDSPFDRETHSGQYNAQAWALTHLLLLGGQKGRSAQLDAFLKAYRSQSSDAAFRAAFAGDYDGLEKELRDYVARPRLAGGLTPRQLVERKYRVVTASALEVEVALGKLALTAGSAELARDHADIAQRLAPGDATGLELQAYVAQRDDNAAEALRASTQALRAGSRDAAMFVMAGDGLRGSVEARQRANLYERAINLNPRCLGVYARLAEALALLDKPSAQDLKFLELGRRLYPQEASLQLAAAELAGRLGRPAVAPPLLDGRNAQASTIPALGL